MATYKVYKHGNYLEVIDTDNGQLWNVNVRDARIFRHDMSQEWFDFYDTDKRILTKIFLTNICDKLGSPYTLESFENFIKCSFGLSVVGESCQGFTFTGLPGAPSPDADVLLYEALLKFQSGTATPDETIIKDDILGVWTRQSAGTYRYTKSNTFAINKTFFTLTNGYYTENVTCDIRVDSSSYVTLKTYNSAGVLSDELIDRMYISIKVRP